MRERARLQKSRRDVADRCGVSEGVVKRWERGESIPSNQQFKRLVGIMVRIAPHAPDWGSFEGSVLSGRLDEKREDITEYIRDIERRAGPFQPKPPAEPFGTGLRRVREENEVSQSELAELLDLTGQAVSAWEAENTTPVQVNLDKLYAVLPELKAGVEMAAIMKPASRDIPAPNGGAGFPRPPTIDTMIEMAWEQSDEEARRPKPDRPKLKTEDFPDHEHTYEDDLDYYGSHQSKGKVCSICGEPEPTQPKEPPKEPTTRIVRGTNHGDVLKGCGCGGDLIQQGDLWVCAKCRAVLKVLSTVSELAEAYGRTRLKVIQAQAREKAAHAALAAAHEAAVNAQTDTRNAVLEASEALELLDLALEEESAK